MRLPILLKPTVVIQKTCRYDAPESKYFNRKWTALLEFTVRIIEGKAARERTLRASLCLMR